jgi:hypothetical protein
MSLNYLILDGAGVIPRIHLPRLKFPRQCVHRIVILD